MRKQPNFFHSVVVLPNDTPAKFILSATFGLSFMISSVAPIRLTTFYAYLNTKNLNSFRIYKILFIFLVPKNPDVPWKILGLTGRSKKSSVFFFIFPLLISHFSGHD